MTHSAEKDAGREDAALASLGWAEPPADGTPIEVAGETWTIRYVPTLTLLGRAGGFDFNGRPTQDIELRQWNERVFLHEVLHVVLNRRLDEFHGAPNWASPDPSLGADPKERIVQAVEDALWELGWRWHQRGADTPAGCICGDTYGPEDCQVHDEEEVEGCICADWCSMGPTCPGGYFAGLPGAACTRITSPAVGESDV